MQMSGLYDYTDKRRRAAELRRGARELAAAGYDDQASINEELAGELEYQAREAEMEADRRGGMLNGPVNARGRGGVGRRDGRGAAPKGSATAAGPAAGSGEVGRATTGQEHPKKRK